MLKLGSLFDGSGGFPLAGVLHGVEPAWASEIEPYPIRVTTARFPAMKHLGDVTKIDGAAIEPVDIITFGSPCQDLSVAGKGAGLQAGTRSNLFYEAIRIIKEMRDATNNLHPRIAVWENVPGAFSSNKGADFQAVLQAFCEISDPDADVPEPPQGKWSPAGTIVGDGWSVAWRTLDAQFWGVPQRRRRIYLIADFGSERSGEILFKQEGLRGHSAKSGTAGQGAAGDAEGGVGGSGGAVAFDCRHMKCDADGTTTPQSKPQGWDLYRQDVVCYPIDLIRESRGAFEAYDEDAKIGGSLKQSDNKGSQVVCYPVENHPNDSCVSIREDGIVPTLSSRMGTGGNNGPMVLETHTAGNGQTNQTLLKEQARTLDCMHDQQIVIEPAKPPRKYIIRRLTPLECCRLQGFPDDWCSGLGTENPTEDEIAFWADVWETHRKIIGASKKPKSRKQIIKWLKDPHSDSAEYKMWGNGLALPNAAHVVGCAVKLIKEEQT